jgi:hypothetical protein
MLYGSCGCLCQKVPLFLACFHASAAPRPENSDLKKIHFFGLDRQIELTIIDFILNRH